VNEEAENMLINGGEEEEGEHEVSIEIATAYFKC
jgi:hypothetical protein